MSVQDRLAELGITLPTVPQPLAAYVPAVVVDGWVYTAGQLPLRDGEPLALGAVGNAVTPEEAAACARQCALNAVAAIASVVDLDDVARIVKVTGFVAATPDFTAHPVVVNGASEFLGSVFGDAGVHARSALGVASLPLGVPVEVEVIARLAN
ncbi:MAG: RidA family protein [Candidatus Nanopelagicales bacterium]